jgi:hypothetical protein
MLLHVAVVSTDISEECMASIMRMTRIGELGTILAVTSNQHMLWRNTVYLLYYTIQYNTIQYNTISSQHASVVSYG